MQHHHQSSSSHSSNHNTQRRIFRGRGGATDRQLPKFNAARRTATASYESGNRVGAVTEQEEIPFGVIDDDDNDDDDKALYKLEIIDPFVIVAESEQTTTTTSSSTLEHHHQQHRPDDTDDDKSNALTQQPPPSLPFDVEEEDKKFQQEIQHLLRRIKQLRCNWSKSKTGNIITRTYQTNVIYASLNIIQKEYTSIHKKYYHLYYYNGNVVTTNASNTTRTYDNTNHDSGIRRQQQQLKLVSNEIFALIQHSIQCGPLSGSQAGYFKRCGCDVATMVYQYLNSILCMAVISPPTTTTTTMSLVPSDQDNTSVSSRKSIKYTNTNQTNNLIDNVVNENANNIGDTKRVGSDDDDDDSVYNINRHSIGHCDEADSDFDDDDGDGDDDDGTADDESDTMLQRQPLLSDTASSLPVPSNYFTPSQMKILRVWTKNAYQASTNNNKNKPSKSMIQKTNEAQQIQNEKRRIKALKGR